MDYEAPDFLSSRRLPEPVRRIGLDLVAATAAATAASSPEETITAAHRRADRFEVALRTVALQRLSSSASTSSNNSNNSNDRVQALVELWQQAARAVCHVLYFAEQQHQQPVASSAAADETTQQQQPQQQLQQQQLQNYTSLKGAASQLRRLPIVLLEDILDTLSLADGYTFWKACCSNNNSSESSSPLLFGPILWKNSLSGSSSSSKQPPTWLPFLKCANKLLRRLQARESLAIGIGNATATNSNNVSAAVAAADVLQVLSRIYPMSEKSATRVWGSHNADHAAVLESNQPEAATSSAASGESAAAAAAATPQESSLQAAAADDGLYESFWLLQQDFRNPNGVVVADFLQRLATVLRTFQNNPVTVATNTTTATKTTEAAASMDNNNNTALILAQPYLTHRRLLPIQLRDPALRTAVLVQFGIVANHLISQVPQLRPQLQPHLDAAQQLLFPSDSRRRRRSSKNSNANTQQQQELHNILERSELQWRTWKQNKCQPDIEPPPRKQTAATSKRKANGSSSAPADAPSAKRRQRSHHRRASRSTTTANSEDDEEKAYEWSADDNLSYLQSVAQTLHAPTATDHLEDYVEALDPDAGIEPEYHPKNDALYSWRALRLLAATHLQDFAAGLHPSGDFETLVRTMYRRDRGVEIPGAGPAAYAGEPESSGDDEQQELEAQEQGEEEGEPAPIDRTIAQGEDAAMQEEEEVDIDIGEKDHDDYDAAADADMKEEPASAPENVARENGFVDDSTNAMDVEHKPQDETGKEPAVEARKRGDDRRERSSDRADEAHPDKMKTTAQQNGNANMSPGGDEKVTGRGNNSRSPSSSRNQQPPQQHPTDGGRKPHNRSESGGYQQRGPLRPPYSSDHRRDYRPQDDGHYRGGRNVDYRGGGRGGAAAAAAAAAAPPPAGGHRPEDRSYRDRDGSGGAPGRGGGGRGGGYRRDYGRRDESRGRRGGRGDRSRR